MKIAVLIGGLRFDSQRRIMNGILEKAVFDGTDVLFLPVIRGPILLLIILKEKLLFSHCRI
ncbi:MAG: hypothetical protein V8S42_04800 [Lachnospiraceae bacterium]